MLYIKQKGSVGYTIVGSPTIVDGIVSNFSSSNYLLFNSTIDTGKSFEFITDITTGSNTNYQTIFGSSEAFIFRLTVSDSHKIQIQAGNGSSFGSEIKGTTTITANNSYQVKVLYDGQNMIVYLKPRNGSWSEEINTNVGSLPTFTPRIGSYYTSSYTFRGSIDLNQTYITVNGQAWFGVCPVEVKQILLNSNDVQNLVVNGVQVWQKPS